MSKIKEIKSRIKSVRDVQQITRAMKMVAAARLRKIESRFNGMKSYLESQESLISFITARNAWARPKLMRSREIKRSGILVFSADKGLCGAFNNNVIKKTLGEIRTRGEKPLILGVGKKGNYILKREQFNLEMDITGIFGKIRFADALSISRELIRLYSEGEYDELCLVLNRFKPRGEPPVGVFPLLPLTLPEVETDAPDYLYEPDTEAVIERLVPYYFSLRIYYFLLESEAAEFFARMTAMDAASDNATELISELTLEYNRARQAAITKEILDIVGGAEALKE